MGLDALDLAYRLEKRFGIKISTDEALAVLFNTPGDIHRYLVAKLRGEYQQTPCIEPLLWEISRAVSRNAGLWRRLIPSHNMNTKFPPAVRADKWQALEKMLGVSLPQLEHPEGNKCPKIPRQYESEISLVYWIAENYPERVEWMPVACNQNETTDALQWSEEEVWTILRECISDALGVKFEKVTPDVRMVEDLGME